MKTSINTSNQTHISYQRWKETDGQDSELLHASAFTVSNIDHEPAEGGGIFVYTTDNKTKQLTVFHLNRELLKAIYRVTS